MVETKAIRVLIVQLVQEHFSMSLTVPTKAFVKDGPVVKQKINRFKKKKSVVAGFWVSYIKNIIQIQEGYQGFSKGGHLHENPLLTYNKELGGTLKVAFHHVRCRHSG